MPETILDKSSGIADADADAKKAVVVAVYDETPPTNTDGDVRPLRIDGEGRLMVNVTGGGAPVGSDTELPPAVAPTDADTNVAAPAVNAHVQAWTGAVWSRLLALASAPASNALGLVVRVVGGAMETTADAIRIAAVSLDAKFPAAATPGDADANIAVSAVLTRLQAWTGSVWERVHTGALGGLLIESADMPAAEDNTNAVIAVAAAPFASLTFANGNPATCVPYSNRGAFVTDIVNGSPGKVYAMSCTNRNASDRYIQLHNTTAALTGGEAPQLSRLVPGNGAQLVLGSDHFTQFGHRYSVGVTMAFSTTEDTYTPGLAADQSTEIYSI